MIHSRKIFALLLLGIFVLAPALEAARRERKSSSRRSPASQAREYLGAGDAAEAVVAYKKALTRRDDPAVRSEYAFALAKLGLRDAALIQLDQASADKPLSGSSRWFAAKILGLAGVDAASEELGADLEAPDWLKKREAADFPDSEKGDSRPRFLNANRLAAEKQFHLSAAEFAAALRQTPGDFLGWIGYSMALEKLGALKSANKALDKAAQHTGSSEMKKRLLDTRRSQIAVESESKPSRRRRREETKSDTPSDTRVLLFGGGSWGGGTTSLSARIGVFVTPTMDAGLDLSVSGLGQTGATGNQLGLGVSTRRYWPLKSGKSGSFALGGRVNYQSEKVSLTISPGYTSPLADGFLDVTIHSDGFMLGITFGGTSYLGTAK